MPASPAPLTLRYDADLPFQREAIAAAVDLFAGQPLADSALSISLNAGPLLASELGTGNNLVLDDAALLENLHRVQERNGIPMATALGSKDFAVEMETGTGKTYVFLRTAFALHAAYGFSKYVIVVPSVAIREGVLHSIATMAPHFRALYGVPFDAAVYDSKQLGRLRQFATANTLQFLVINIQAFQRDAGADDESGGNVIYREQDRMSGHRPIEFLQATRPIVIIDEPQSAASGDASAKAISRLHPLCTLRYSATYEHPNKLYRLGPIEALDQRLVKRIEVASVVEEAPVNDAYVRLLKTDIRNQRAQVEIAVRTGSDAAPKKVWVKSRDDLYVKSGENQSYRDGFIVQTIDFAPGEEALAFSGGVQIRPGQAAGGVDDDVMREQVRETVREHVDKERKLRPKGIKVLSLFFIDKVANYRTRREDGGTELGKIGRWFEEAYREIAALPANAGLTADPVEAVHDGYFAQDRKGGYKDSAEGRGNRDDEAAYELIMRNKERLLSLDEPLRFIFSHSALREGWDNPNVFQICTLNESKSVTRKRQEIGRGLRLPVDQQGERVRDEGINRLTVVANESYRVFAQALQTEYEEDARVRFGVVPPQAFALIDAAPAEADTPQPLGQAASRVVWDHLREAGYLDADGTVTDRFDPRADGFVLDVPAAFEAIRPHIADAVNGFLFRNRVVNKRERATIAVRKNVLLDEEFEALWKRIAQKTRYRISFDGEELIRKAAERIRNGPAILPPSIAVETAILEVGRAGVEVDAVRRTDFRKVQREWAIPDVLAYLQNETELTRRTLARILIESGRAEESKVNPQQFVSLAEKAIRGVLHEMMVPGIEYERVAGQEWAMDRLERDAEEALVRYLDNLYRVQSARKTPFDYVEYQSEVEHEFARRLDGDERVKFFVKLPAWFRVDTPLGPYNPDWAILLQGETDKLYLVRETKGTTTTAELRQIERDKIACGKKHFAAIEVNFDVARTVDDVLKPLALAGR